MSDVFISYVRENKKEIDKIVEDLREFNIKVWIDRKNLSPGDRWRNEIKNAISNGSFFMACFSKEYSERTKTYMNEELNLAVDELRQLSPDEKWFIPVLLSDCEIPNFEINSNLNLKDFQKVDLHKDWECGIYRIISVINPNAKEQFKASSIKDNLIFKKPFYYQKKQEDEPFCQLCLDSESKLIHVQPFGNGVWHCYKCKNDFYEEKFNKQIHDEVEKSSGNENHVMQAKGKFIAQADHGSTANVTINR